MTEPLSAGSLAPDFALPDQDGRLVTKASLAGRRVVMFFYPKAFTPGCTGESCDFRDRWERFDGSGYVILGVSPDPIERLAEFKSEYNLPYDLLSDEDHATAAAYSAWGIKKNYGKEYEGLIRSTVAIDESGRVSDAWYNVRAKGHAARVADALLSG